MESIRAEQAVFASSNRGSMKGYQLVGRSAGIDRGCAQQLALWSPTKMVSNDSAQWTINYFPISESQVAITRTVLGGPEYSSRGGTQVVTLMLILNNDQFACYRCNAIAVSRTAMATGWLRLPLDLLRQNLDPVELPGRPFDERTDDPDDDRFDRLLDEITGLIDDARRIAVLGVERPRDVISQLIPNLSVDARREFSFTSGLAPAVKRPFRLHFLPAVDNTTKRTLDSQNVVCVQG